MTDQSVAKLTSQYMKRPNSSRTHARPAPFHPNGDRGTSKRERILDAGLTLFAHEPYQAVTMDRVAQAAAVAKGTLYLYFQSKEDLYLGILSDGMEAITRINQSNVETATDVQERLRRAITSTIEYYDAHRDLLRLIATEEPRMAEARSRLIQGWRDRGRQFFRSLIEEGMGTGEFRAGDPLLATIAIMGGLRSVLLYYGSGRPVAELSSEFAELVTKALGADAPGARKAPPVS
jgi:AcrR family transcriptional regulator